jgi:flagellar hook-length control protein FliK
MMNSAAPVKSSALAGIAPPAAASAPADGEAAFAQALENAAAHRHDARPAREGEPKGRVAGDATAADDKPAATDAAEASTPQAGRRLARHGRTLAPNEHAANSHALRFGALRDDRGDRGEHGARGMHGLNNEAPALPSLPLVADDEPAAEDQPPVDLAALLHGLAHPAAGCAADSVPGQARANRADAAAEPAADAATATIATIAAEAAGDERRQTQPRSIDSTQAAHRADSSALPHLQPIADDGAAAPAGAADSTRLAQALPLSRSETSAAPAPGSPAAALAPNAAGMPPTARVGEAPASFQAHLAAALGSPEFAPALGTQISLLVRDGIQHAQLQLHPLELGPIAVRISLDGNQAQVDFHAAQAGTRQALEEAVPALAGALREAGFTLSGGGVFQHARDPRSPWHGSPPDRAARADDGSAERPLAGAAPFTRSRGMVDLYA